MDEPAPSILEVERRYSIDSPDEREQRFRVLFDEGPVGIVLLGSDLRFIAVNDAFCKLLQYSASELLRRSFADVTHPDDRKRNLDTARRIFAGEWSTVRVEKRYLRKDGEVVDVHVTGWPIRDSTDRITHSVAVVQDVTAQKRAKRRTAQLRTALMDRETLLREVHHRVKNNLQIVSSLLSLQLGNLADSEMRVLVQESQARIAAMAMVHETLYQADDLTSIDLPEYLTDIVEALALIYGDKPGGIAVDLSFDPLTLDIDGAVRCGLIVNELVSNAYKHAFKGRSTGRISLALSEDPGGAKLIIADDGNGMPSTLCLETVESLGLQLVVNLVQQLNGAISIIRDKGTTFQIAFKRQSPSKPR